MVGGLKRVFADPLEVVLFVGWIDDAEPPEGDGSATDCLELDDAGVGIERLPVRVDGVSTVRRQIIRVFQLEMAERKKAATAY